MLYEVNDSGIVPGAGGKLVVPREDFASEVEEGTELDTSSCLLRLRKPGRREWVVIFAKQEFVTKLLVNKKIPDAIDTEYLQFRQLWMTL